MTGQFVFGADTQCAGKARFASAALAHRVAKRRSKFNDRKTAKPGDVYHCAHCGGWHIGRSLAHLKRRPG